MNLNDHAINDAWELYKADTIPPEAHELQVRDAKRHFFAGHFAVTMALFEMTKANKPPEWAGKQITLWGEEFMMFSTMVNGGLA